MSSEGSLVLVRRRAAVHYSKCQALIIGAFRLHRRRRVAANLSQSSLRPFARDFAARSTLGRSAGAGAQQINKQTAQDIFPTIIIIGWLPWPNPMHQLQLPSQLQQPLPTTGFTSAPRYPLSPLPLIRQTANKSNNNTNGWLFFGHALQTDRQQRKLRDRLNLELLLYERERTQARK